MFDYELYYIFAIVTTTLSLVAYMLIRDIIWSIARCDIGDTSLKSMEIKKNKNFSMSYLSNYITAYKKQYIFWMKVKKIYEIGELAWLIIYLLIPLANCDLTWPFNINYAQAGICFFVMRIQFDSDRLTKYDIIRLKNLKNNH